MSGIVGGVALALTGIPSGNNVVNNIMETNMRELAYNLTDIRSRSALSCTNYNEIALYDCNLKDSKIKQLGMCKQNLKMQTDNNVENNITQQAQIKGKQAAKEVLQSFTINPGSTLATNIGKQTSSAFADISNRINHSCSNSAHAQNIVECRNADGLYGNYIRQDTISDSMVNCAMANDIVNTTSQSLTAEMGQIGSSTTQNTMLWIAIGFIAVVVAFIINIVLIGSTILTWLFILLIVAIILVFVFTLYYNNSHKDQINRPYKDRCADCTKMATKVDCENSNCKWTGGDKTAVSILGYPSLEPLCKCDTTTHNCTKQCYLKLNKKDCEKSMCYWDNNSNLCTGQSTNLQGTVLCRPNKFG